MGKGEREIERREGNKKERRKERNSYHDHKVSLPIQSNKNSWKIRPFIALFSIFTKILISCKKNPKENKWFFKHQSYCRNLEGRIAIKCISFNMYLIWICISRRALMSNSWLIIIRASQGILPYLGVLSWEPAIVKFKCTMVNLALPWSKSALYFFNKILDDNTTPMNWEVIFNTMWLTHTKTIRNEYEAIIERCLH